VATISFNWSANVLAEWVWAPVFNADKRLNQIKNSPQEPIVGSAQLEWQVQEQRWDLVSLQPFKTQ